MGKIIKYAVIAALILGVYTLARAHSEGREHKAFVKGVEDEVQTIFARWSEDEGRENLEAAVRRVAAGHGVTLDPGAVEVKYRRTEKKSGKASPYTHVNRAKGQIEFGTMQGYMIYANARVTVTYDREITPFYTKRLTFSRSSKRVLK